MKSFLKRIIPNFIFSWYHYCLSFLGAIIYRFPSRKMIIIGITGTKGKSTTLYLTGKILEESGWKVGWISSLSIKNRKKEKINPYHMTMPGRFFIQRMLRQFYKNNCQIALIEVTSEGIKQFRHKFINFDTLIFTNLSPEHIESHGGFEKYKETKNKLFQALNNFKRKKINGQKMEKVIVANLDSPHTNYFLSNKSDKKIGYGLKTITQKTDIAESIHPVNLKIEKDLTTFTIDQINFHLNLLGEFNAYNALAAIAVASHFKVPLKISQQALQKISILPGRMERIQISQKQNFSVFIDLAHTPGSFQEVFTFVKNKLNAKNIISVFGAAGGGRDKWKRPEMGKIAGNKSSFIILTDEDPYNENPQTILQDIVKGIQKTPAKYEKIPNRQKAIKKALEIAKANDVILFLGKGTETSIQYKDKAIPWNERKVVEEELKNLF